MASNDTQGTAVITGASAGLGAAYAERLADRGHDLLLIARGEERLAALAASIADRTGRRVETLTADLSVAADLQRVEQRLREDAAVSVLINNAGIAAQGGVGDVDPQRLQSMIDLNITAVTRLTAAVAPGFTERGRGTIVNISSGMAILLMQGTATYSASKAYVLAFTQALDADLAPHGVRVQAVVPGAVRTAFWDGSGVELDTLPPSIVMSVDAAVDAALAGLDAGELVTIPSLPDAGDWHAFDAARQTLTPNVSRDRAADRYEVAA